jgi:hypothetical protein
MIQPITENEKTFTLSYHSLIAELQEKAADGLVVYTKITLSHAILHNLCYTNLVFHPKSIDYHKSWLRPDLSQEMVKKTLEEIIVYELSVSRKKSKLTSEELLDTITYFRTLDQKKLM